MIPEITQGIEASGVMFGGQQGRLVKSVSVLMPKAVQAIEASGIMCLVVNKTAKQPVNYQLSLVASAFIQKMSSRTALKQYKVHKK